MTLRDLLTQTPDREWRGSAGSAESYTTLVSRTGGHLIALAALTHAQMTIAAAGIWEFIIVIALVAELFQTGMWGWATASRTRLRRDTEGYEA